MLVNTLLVILIVGGLLGFVVWYYGQRKRADAPAATASGQPDAQGSPVAEREAAIVSVQRLAALGGVMHQTNINSLIDKCVDVHVAITGVSQDEAAQLHSVPGDFRRLLDKHLPEMVERFAQLGDSPDANSVAQFNQLVTQLEGELDAILENIKNKNYMNFAAKSRFMEVRYSDKF